MPAQRNEKELREWVEWGNSNVKMYEQRARQSSTMGERVKNEGLAEEHRQDVRNMIRDYERMTGKKSPV